MEIEILVASHKPTHFPQEWAYRPILVGAAQNRARVDTERFLYFDDVGDNISERNAHWCELTGLYWARHNLSSEVIGLCHYRRYFLAPDASRRCTRIDTCVLDSPTIERLLEDKTIILPQPDLVKSSIEGHYAYRHHAQDIKAAKQAIARLAPDYLSTMAEVFGGRHAYWGNMFITRRTVFESYFDWVYPILEELERMIDVTNYDPYQKRALGFLAERLFNVWIAANIPPEQRVELPIMTLPQATLMERLKKVLSLPAKDRPSR